jgi:plasmid stabilization system protein ParE
MYTVLFLERADKDLQSIVDYIASDDPQAAEKLRTELLQLALSLNSFPYRGSQVKRRPGLFKLIHGNYLIYYRISGGKR